MQRACCRGRLCSSCGDRLCRCPYCRSPAYSSCRLGTASGRWRASGWGASATRASRSLVNRSYPTALSSSGSRCRRCRFPRAPRPQPHYRSRRSAGMGTPGPWRGGPTMQQMPERCPPICYASTPRRGPRPTPPSAAAWRRRWLCCPPSRRRGRGRARASPPRVRSSQARLSCPARLPRPGSGAVQVVAARWQFRPRLLLRRRAPTLDADLVLAVVLPLLQGAPQKSRHAEFRGHWAPVGRNLLVIAIGVILQPGLGGLSGRQGIAQEGLHLELRGRQPRGGATRGAAAQGPRRRRGSAGAATRVRRAPRRNPRSSTARARGSLFWRSGR
mmetsp:Transcript_86175/g.278443  ORF Transcript_86175/g.278443 Transcript_86175/m.278443 type:complete len:330 (-) Transcript_86175:168-1157(-)